MKKISKIISTRVLQQLVPLKNIPLSSLKKISQDNVPLSYEKSNIIFNRGQEDEYIYYLLKGKVVLFDHDNEETIIAGSSAALVPLDNTQPRKFSARAANNIIVLRLNRNLIDIYTNTTDDEIKVNEILEDDIDVNSQLMFRLYKEYMDGNLKLSSLPELAIRVRKAIQDADRSAHDIATIIQSDPAITGQIIKIANSPLYRTTTQINDCQSAISRIGLENTRDIVTSLSVRQLFRPKTKTVAREMSALWKHSTHVAAISAVIAEKIPSINSDRALLAGLTHDIGILAILSYAEQFPDLIKDRKVLSNTIQQLGAQMGALVLRYWSMPSDLVTVALESEIWARDSTHGPDLCDVVLVAQIHSFAGSELNKQIPALIDTPAFKKLPLSRGGPEKSLELLQKAHEHIVEMKHLLI